MSEALTPEDLAAAGKAAFERGEFEAAANAFQAAADGFNLAEDLLNAAEMKNNCSVALLQDGNAQGALAAVKGTAEVFAEAQATREQALALGNEAAARHALGNIEEAEALFRQSADLLAETGDDELRASVLRSISELQLKQGRHLEAVASMHAGLDGLEKPKPRQRLVRKLLEMPLSSSTVAEQPSPIRPVSLGQIHQSPQQYKLDPELHLLQSTRSRSAFLKRTIAYQVIKLMHMFSI